MIKQRKLSIIGANKLGEIKMESGNGEDEAPTLGTDYMVAKGRLQGVLKLLTERSDSENSSSLDGDDGYARRQKRQKLLAAGATNKQQPHNIIGGASGYRHTYVMKLFDRSVDLAKFEEDTPLYPICRAWMANQPRNAIVATRRPLISANSNLWLGAACTGDVYRLPVAQGPPPGRVPSPTPQQRHVTKEIDIEYGEERDALMSKEQLIRAHLKRWVGVKRKWIRTAALHEERYAKSKHILQAIYNKAQDTLLE